MYKFTSNITYRLNLFTFAIKLKPGMGFLHLLTCPVHKTQIKFHPFWEDFLDPSARTGELSLPKTMELTACLTQLALAIPPCWSLSLIDSASFGIKKSQVQSYLGHLPAV